MTQSAAAIIQDLRTRYRGAPVLTLAQTVLWDDPCKAAFKRLLDLHAPDTPFVLGVMDTDYFSRLPKPPPGRRPFDVLPHNDGSTRDLWAAVGEASSLLGAETPLKGEFLTAMGVNVPLAARGADVPLPRYRDVLTEAWGWRGIAQTQGQRILAGDVPLSALGESLLQQIDWAISETRSVAARPAGPFAANLRESAEGFLATNPKGTLADLYLHLLPALYENLLGYEPEGLEYTRSSELLRFNRSTAARARFRPLDVFLNPQKGPVARREYNAAVHSSGITTLDRFGPHAVPFDLAIPGRGRGTLHIGPREITVDTDERIVIPLADPVSDRRTLARIIETEFGDDVALLGKAVVLITMLAGEFIFLFNETGSPYVRHSCEWNTRLTREGMGFRLYPILRLGLHPWDVVDVVGGEFSLPDHLARAFGAQTVPAADFRNGWREVVNRAASELETIRSTRKPCEWLASLSERDGDPERWSALRNEYIALCTERARHGSDVAALNGRTREMHLRLKRLNADIQVLERRKGVQWREVVRPATESGDAARIEAALGERARIEDELRALRDEVSTLKRERSVAAEERRALLSDPVVTVRRDRLAAIAAEAEAEKAIQVRDYAMAAAALTHTEARPSAWWFPVVDTSGAWFRAVEATTDYRWENLTGGACEEPFAHAPMHEPAVLSI